MKCVHLSIFQLYCLFLKHTFKTKLLPNFFSFFIIKYPEQKCKWTLIRYINFKTCILHTIKNQNFLFMISYNVPLNPPNVFIKNNHIDKGTCNFWINHTSPQSCSRINCIGAWLAILLKFDRWLFHKVIMNNYKK